MYSEMYFGVTRVIGCYRKLNISLIKSRSHRKTAGGADVSLWVLMYGDARYHGNGMQARGGLALQIGEHCSPASLRCSNILLTQITLRKEQKPCAPLLLNQN